MYVRLIILLLISFGLGRLNAQSSKSEKSQQTDTSGKSEKQLMDDYLKKQNQLVTIIDTGSVSPNNTAIAKESTSKLKFIILCFDSSPSNNDEIASLNKLAYEYRNHISSIVIYADDLNKYTEIFTRNEFRSLQLGGNSYLGRKSE